MAKCLKDKEEHDTPTDISSECTDFIALNVACADDIAKFCDDAFFTDDTMLCLSEWNRQNLGAKCAKVVQWAAPQKNVDGPTDELGLSEKDYDEKRKWQADRKAGRGAAIEKMREDKTREDEMAALQKDDPEAYKLLLKEQEEAKRSYEDQKKRKRLLAAAEERKQREEDGEPEEPEVPEEKTVKKRRFTKPAEKGSWLPYALGGCVLAFVLANVINFFTKDKEEKEEKDD